VEWYGNVAEHQFKIMESCRDQSMSANPNPSNNPSEDNVVLVVRTGHELEFDEEEEIGKIDGAGHWMWLKPHS
jgi:hypothetical protein